MPPVRRGAASRSQEIVIELQRGAQTCRRREAGGRQRGDRQPCPERAPGDLRGDARGRADGARRDRLRAADAPAGAARAHGRAHRAGAPEPDLPGPRRGRRGRARAARVQRGAVHPHREHVGGGIRRDAARAAGLGDDLRRRPVRRGRRAARALPAPLQAAPAGRARQRGRRAPRLSAGLDRRRRRDGAGLCAISPSSGTSGSGSSSGRPTMCRRAQARRLRARAAGGTASAVRAGRAHELLARGRPRRRDAPDRARRDRHHLRQRPAGARRDPAARRAGLSVPADLSVSASTTRRS